MFHFEQNFTLFFHVRRRYGILFMIEKESLNFLTQFFNYLHLLNEYVYPNLELIKAQTGQVFDRVFEEDKLFSIYFKSKF